VERCQELEMRRNGTSVGRLSARLVIFSDQQGELVEPARGIEPPTFGSGGRGQTHLRAIDYAVPPVLSFLS
jgi:hypothetical protein